MSESFYDRESGRFGSEGTVVVHGVERKIRTVLLVGRASSSSGRSAMTLAVNDLIAGAKGLHRSTGFDVRPHLPNEEELMRRLANATSVRSVSKGRRFSNRFVELDLRAVCGVYVVLSIGTAKKIDEESGEQPFVERLTAVARDIKPSLVYAQRIDRLVRMAWALGPLMVTLCAQGGLVGDSLHGFDDPDGQESILLFFRAKSGENQAGQIPSQTRGGMERRTGRTMVDGRVPFHANRVAPPGFALVRSRSATGGLGTRWLILDTPMTRPAESDTAMGLPAVMDEDGQPVDQVANVMWALANLGKAGMTATIVADTLIERGYSTDGLRRFHSPSTTYRSKGRRDRVIDGIIDNLELYRSGVLRFDFNVDDVDAIEITGCFPACGQWATPSDFERIDRWLAARARRRGGRRRLTLSGLRVECNGSDAVLVVAPNHRDYPDRVAYMVCNAAGYPDRRRSLPGTPALPASHLSRVIALSIADAGDKALPLIAPSLDADVATLEARRALTTAQIAVDQLTGRLTGLREQLLARRPDGTPVLTGALAADINDDYNRINETELKQALLALDDAEASLRRAEEHTLAHRNDIEATRLAELVHTLRDPTDRTWSDALLSDLHLTITTTPTSQASHGGHEVAIEGHLCIDSGFGAVDIPIAGSWLQGSVADVGRRVTNVIAAMTGGIPYKEAPVKRTKDLVYDVATALGADPRFFWLPNCTDPTITKVAMAALYTRGGRTDQQIACDLDVPEELVTRVVACRQDFAGTQWLQKGPVKTLGQIHRLAAENDGLVTFTTAQDQFSIHRTKVVRTALKLGWTNLEGIGYQMPPCTHCGSHNLSPLTMREPIGPVCLDCRRDQSGLVWPADPYDSYVLTGRR